MDTRPPIDRVRENQDNTRHNVKSAKDSLSRKDAKLQREASEGAPIQESEDQFEERMRQKLKDSGEENDD